MKNEEKGNFNINDLLKKARENSNAPKGETDVNKFIDENLSEAQAQAVKDILSDEGKTKQILNSDAAKELFKKFFGGN
jgi:hypothetical protein